MDKAKAFLAYLATAFAKLYIIGFFIGDDIYAVVLKELPEWIYKLSRDTDGIHKLKLKEPDKINKRLLAMGAKKIAERKDLDPAITNKGIAFEKLIYQLNGQKWKGHNSIPYYLAGDIEIDGIPYQIKFEYATLARFDTIEKALQR